MEVYMAKKNCCTKKITSIGGSALIEGIMMRGPKRTTVCVRTDDKTIYSEDIGIKTISEKVKLFKLPLLRGVAGLIDSMRLSYKALMISADKAIEAGEIEEEEPSKFEKWLDEKVGDKLVKILMVFSSILGVAFAIGLFFFLPTYLFSWSSNVIPAFVNDVKYVCEVPEGATEIMFMKSPDGPHTQRVALDGKTNYWYTDRTTLDDGSYRLVAESVDGGDITYKDTENWGKVYLRAFNGDAELSGEKGIEMTVSDRGVVWIYRSVFEGILKIILFLGYILIVSQMGDMKRVFMYHGAEHKTIFCYENEEELTVENVKKQIRFHPRCGTSFMVIMLIIGILIGLFVPAKPFGIAFLRPVIKLLLLPLSCGVGYELIKICGRHDNTFTRIISAPGLWAQRITTKEPDDKMIEVAIKAIEEVIPDDGSDIINA